MKNKKSVILFIIFSAAAAMAWQTSEIWPMQTSFPKVPAGENPAVYPVPRLDWFWQVAQNNANAEKIGSAAQVIFDGDSITYGWKIKGKTVWDERYSKYNAVDFGISGDRTQHVLWRLFQGQGKTLSPKLVVLMIGTNNIYDDTAEQIAEGVKEIIKTYRDRFPDAVILLQAIFPRGEEPASSVREKIKETNRIISTFGDGKKVVYVDFGNKFLEADGRMSPEIMPDFLHPSEKGYIIWANAIQPYIDTYLGSAAK